MAKSVQDGRGLLTELPSPFQYGGQDRDPAGSTAMIASMIPSGARVLDVGCGTGSVSRLSPGFFHGKQIIVPQQIAWWNWAEDDIRIRLRICRFDQQDN